MKTIKRFVGGALIWLAGVISIAVILRYLQYEWPVAVGHAMAGVSVIMLVIGCLGVGAYLLTND